MPKKKKVKKIKKNKKAKNLKLKAPPFFLAVSNVATVITIAIKNNACATIDIPIIQKLPTYIENTMHHIHANSCITRCRVLVSGMWDSGLRRLSIIE